MEWRECWWKSQGQIGGHVIVVTQDLGFDQERGRTHNKLHWVLFEQGCVKGEGSLLARDLRQTVS